LFGVPRPIRFIIAMHPLIDAARQEKAKRYEKRRGALGVAEISISVLFNGAFFLTGASGRAAAFASRAPMPAALLLYAFFFVPLWVLLFPLDFLKDYALEKEFGLSTQTVKSWLLDRLKGLLLSAVIGYPLLLLLFVLFRRAPGSWWVFAASGLFVLQLFLTFVFPVLLLPLFFRQTPVEDGDLKSALTGLFEKAGISVLGIYSFNMSAKSTKENAALTGIWKTRRILIADTLLGKRDPDAKADLDTGRCLDKVLAVVAHEAGHHAKSHMLQLSLLGLAASFATLYILHRVMGLFHGFPVDFQRTLALAPVLGLAAGAISFPLRIATNAFSRAKECEADEMALELTGNPDAFIRLMADLANTNLAVAYPRKLKVLLSCTHPPIGERIAAAEPKH
jgi:STE24 endopeptidase